MPCWVYKNIWDEDLKSVCLLSYGGGGAGG